MNIEIDDNEIDDHEIDNHEIDDHEINSGRFASPMVKVYFVFRKDSS